MAPHPRTGPGVGRAPAAPALLVSCALLLLAACREAPPAAGDEEASSLRLTSFRVRDDFRLPLDADTGWAGAEGEDVVVTADRRFRVRFEAEGGRPGDTARLRLQVRRNAGAWASVPAADHPYPDGIASPRVSVVEAPGWSQGTPAGDLLHGSTLPFRPGSGVSLDSTTAAWAGAGAHGEWEWPVVIRRFADGAVTNDEGDTFQLRLTDAAGRPVPGVPGPTLRLAVPPGHLGGTFVETPGRLGPWQTDDGSLYFVMEPAETDNVLMVVKSEDGGRSWRETDGPNRPSADDLEGFATAFQNGVVHMLHQTSDAVWYHAFRTVDGDGTEGWAVRDEEVATPGEPPVQVAALAARADGSLVAVYGDPAGLRYRIRGAGGGWGEERRVDAPSGMLLSGPQAARAPGDAVHLAYTARDGTEGSAWIRGIGADGSLAPPLLLARGLGSAESDVGSVAPLVPLPAVGQVVVPYRLADGRLWERRLRDDGSLTAPVRVTERRVAQNAVDSDQVGADAVGAGDRVHVLFIDDATGSIHHTWSDGGGAWSEPAPVVEGVTAQWVRGARVERPDGTAAYGFVYDAGSDGGSGMNRYAEVPLGGG